MYTIDLLKGEGVPIRSRPGGIAFACLIVVVPFLVGVAGVSFYLDCDVVLSIQRQQLSKLEAGVGALSGALKRKESLEEEKAQAIYLLSDVRTALGGRTQWSPALAALVRSLSDSLILTRLEARQDTMRYKVPAKDDPAKKIEISVPVRGLKITVCGPPMGISSEAVRTLQENLRSSDQIGPMLDTIAVSQNSTKLNGQDAVLYELNCTFKPAIP